MYFSSFLSQHYPNAQTRISCKKILHTNVFAFNNQINNIQKEQCIIILWDLAQEFKVGFNTQNSINAMHNINMLKETIQAISLLQKRAQIVYDTQL